MPSRDAKYPSIQVLLERLLLSRTIQKFSAAMPFKLNFSPERSIIPVNLISINDENVYQNIGKVNIIVLHIFIIYIYTNYV